MTGIGGVFFRSNDPKGLAAWDLEHLGVGAPAGLYIWKQQAGSTVFAPFEKDSDYFAADKRFMLNLRVDDLTGVLASLGAAGKVMHFISLLVPLTFDALANLLIDEGRARERDDRENPSRWPTNVSCAGP